MSTIKTTAMRWMLSFDFCWSELEKALPEVIPMLNTYHLDIPRVHVLVSLYNNTRSELMRYRDIQWHVTAYVVGLQGAFLVLIANDKFRSLWSTFGRGIITTILFVFAVVGISLIWIFHNKFKEHRVRRATLDRIFGFEDNGIFEEVGVALLPKEKMGALNIYPILFTALIVVMGFVTVYTAIKI